MNVICLYWVGNFRGRDFCLKDVERLYQIVKEKIDCEFFCLTNTEEKLSEGINRIPLLHNWPGWWSKIELHRPDLPLSGRTLYIDLDSYVVGDLSRLFTCSGNLVMFSSRAREGQGVVRRYQAGVMVFDPGSTSIVYHRFKKNPAYFMNQYRSDQDVIGGWLPDQPTFPSTWLMKLSQCRNMDVLPDDCIVVTGQPKGISFRDTAKIKWSNG